MTIEARLRQDRTNKDGTRSLRIYVYQDGKHRFYTTGIRLKSEQWNAAKQQVKGVPRLAAQSYHAKLEAIKEQYREKLEKGIPADRLDSNVVGDLKNGFLLDFLSLFIKEAKGGLHSISQSTIKNYQSAFTRIEDYSQVHGIPDLAFDRVNMDWYRSYYLWIQEQGYGSHGFDNHIKIVKRIMREAHKRGLHDNQIWQNRDFKPMKKGYSDKIYLTIADIQKIEELDLSAIPNLEREKDRFLISYYFLMRWEDSTRISRENVLNNGGMLLYRYTSAKTKVKCLVPIKTSARRLLEKYNYTFGADSNQKCNEKIKEICSMAGINSIVKQGGHTAAKYRFVTTHTARRSAATNLYMEGMDLETLARIGGWKKLETLKIYLRASGMDVVQRAKGFDFFSG